MLYAILASLLDWEEVRQDHRLSGAENHPKVLFKAVHGRLETREPQ